MVRWVQQSYPGLVACVQTLRLLLCVFLCHRVSSALRSSGEGAFYALDITASLVQYPRVSNGKPLWPHLVSLCLQWLPRTKAESLERATDSLAHKWRGRQPFFSTMMSLWRRHVENENSREAIKQQAISEVALDMGQQWEVSVIMIFTPFFFHSCNNNPHRKNNTCIFKMSLKDKYDFNVTCLNKQKEYSQIIYVK